MNQFKKYLALLGLFWQEKTNLRLMRWNLLCIIIQVAFLIYKFNQLPPQVPLFYSLPNMEDQLASPSQLFFIPIFSITVCVINNVIAAVFVSHRLLLNRLLTVFSLIFSFLALVTLINIIRLIS